ncbi:MAG: putative molybdenum carrier protein [Nitrosomonas sp.]|nr:putative molybdenum carrier protein [Nitrosomonas sp.]
MLEKIISGGQTGADRAALDAALESVFPIGGSCPVGRMAEDGPIDPCYSLTEIGGGYRARTKKNVEDSDGTVIFYDCYLRGGTEQTVAFCIKAGKPYKLIDIDIVNVDIAANRTLLFVNDHTIKVLNAAGPRQSGCPAIYEFVKKTIKLVISKST